MVCVCCQLGSPRQDYLNVQQKETNVGIRFFSNRESHDQPVTIIEV